MEASLYEKGYALLPRMERDLVAILAEYCSRKLSAYGVEEGNKTINTIKESDLGLRYDTHVFICDALSRYLSKHFISYKLLLSSFIIKLKDAKTGIGFHQEPTFTNPQEYDDFTIWIPLVDIPEGAGVLSIVPGSHQWANKINYYLLRPAYLDEIKDTQTVDIVTRAGEPVIFFNRTIHSSKPNTTIEFRPAISLKITNSNAPIYSYFSSDREGWAERYKQDDMFFFQPDWNQEAKPSRSKLDTIVKVD